MSVNYKHKVLKAMYWFYCFELHYFISKTTIQPQNDLQNHCEQQYNLFFIAFI